MKNILQRSILLFSLLHATTMVAPSMVYNFRIAQITKQPFTEKTYTTGHTLVALFFEQFRKKYNGTQQNFLGGLGSYIYDFKPYFFRVDGAVSHIKELANHITTFSGTESDDILLTFGRDFKMNKHNEATVSGFFGIPTHPIFRLRHIDFGYSQFGTGFQIDGSYIINDIHSLLYGMRYLYFVPRTARDDQNNKYSFTVGNVADSLCAYKYKKYNHGLEFGYTARFRFGCSIYPNFDDIVKKTNYIRSDFYGVYKYKLLTKHVSNRLLLYASYGLDHVPKAYGNKYILTFFCSWNISF